MNKRVLLTLSTAFAAVSLFAQTPYSPSDLTAEFKILEDGTYAIEGSFVTPTKAYGGADLTSLTKAVISYYDYQGDVYDWTEFETIENPKLGEKYSFVYPNPVLGHEYGFMVYVYNGTDKNYDTTPTVYAGQQPGPVTGLTVSCENGQPPVIISFVAPEVDGSYKPLTFPLTKITIDAYSYATKETETIATIENPKAGEKYTYTWDGVVESVSYTYKVYAHSATGTSRSQDKAFLCGKDAPYQVTNLQGSETPDGVMLTWDAPTVGKNQGYVDPESVLYKVARIVDGNSTVIAEDLKETTYTDSGKDLTAPTKCKYRVTPYNSIDEGYGETLDSEFVLGPAAPLPFAEDFDLEKSDWWSTSYGPRNSWNFGKNGNAQWKSVYQDNWYESPVIEEMAPGSENGHAEANMSNLKSEASLLLESSRISLVDAEYPMLSFYYAQKEGLSSEINVKLGLADGSAQKLGTTLYLDGTSSDYTWTQKKLQLSKYAGQDNVHLIFEAVYPGEGDGGAVGIDQIVLCDYPSPKNLTFDNATETTVVISWDAPKDSFGKEPVSYKVFIDWMPQATVTETSYEFTGEPNQDYEVFIQPIYADNFVGKNSEEKTFNLTTVGVGSITTAEGVSTYYDLNGRRVINPAEGSVLVKRTVRPNGEVVTSKVVF